MAISQAERLKQAKTILGFEPKVDPMVSAVCNCIVLDIVAVDKQLSEHDPDYDNSKASYKGRKCSMKEYVKQKFSEAEYLFICELLWVMP